MMIDILRKPDDMIVHSYNGNEDIVVETELVGRKLNLYVTANKSHPIFVTLRWNYKADEPVRIMGDKWERSYADLEWRSLNGENFMPWYFLASNGKDTTCCGVEVRPNSFVCFQYDASGVTAWVDLRNGATGVHLNGRRLHACTFLCEHYEGMSEFKAAQKFCKVMCTDPILPKEPVYGSNNWYYAYGKSSYEEIMQDADLIAMLAGQNENKPYMVIDDGWSVNSCCGPWVPNERYGDMKKIADEFKAKGLKPGIWFRPLHDTEAYEQHPEWRISRIVNNEEQKFYLDPSNPEVKQYLRDTIRKITGWGYQLIKHDFSTFDLFGDYGAALNGKITTKYSGWSFYDRTKTNAEIVLDFYKLIREEAGDAVIIGCNTISHLCAGLVEVNRTGDDTSGNHWSRTRALGINTLAFRLCQNKAFYMVDADCVGVRPNGVPWKMNRKWLDLLAKSGSPLFASINPSELTEEMKKDFIEAYKINSVQKDEAEPLDWTYNNEPHKWLINGEVVEYDFIEDEYPILLGGRNQPY